MFKCFMLFKDIYFFDKSEVRSPKSEDYYFKK